MTGTNQQPGPSAPQQPGLGGPHITLQDLLPVRQASTNYKIGNTANITKLNGQNFENWKEEIEIILKLRGLGKAWKPMMSPS